MATKQVKGKGKQNAAAAASAEVPQGGYFHAHTMHGYVSQEEQADEQETPQNHSLNHAGGGAQVGRALRCSRMHQTVGACSISDRLMHGSTILLLCSGEALDASLCWGDAWGICRHGMAAVCRRPRGRAGATTRAVSPLEGP